MTCFDFTPTSSDTTVESGFLVLARSLAQALAAHFQRLIDTSLVVPFPSLG